MTVVDPSRARDVDPDLAATGWMARARVAIVVSYAVAGTVLCLTRLLGLGHSFWHDEIVTTADYVQRGPREILTGTYVPNNHELFSLLAWATSGVAGDGEVWLRFWSVLPFLAGVAIAAAWLHVRVTPLAGILFVFLAAVSPLLLDVTRQARGYGLAFLAMSVVVVSALEARKGGRDAWLIPFFTAGILGTLTLPNFGVAFVSIAVVLAAERRLRRRIATGLLVAGAVTLLWYAPHIDDLLRRTRQDYGVEIGLPWVVTAPIDQILLPALLWIDGVVLFPGIVWLPLVAVAVLLMASSPLLRERATAFVLCAGPVATVLALWLSHTLEVPRFLSFLTVPLFMLLASGMAAIFQPGDMGRPPIVRALVASTTILLLCVGFARTGLDVVRLPREAHKDAAAVVESEAPDAPVFAHVVHPRDIEYYLGRPVVRPPAVTGHSVCTARREVVLIVQDWAIRPAKIPCLRREGTRRYAFPQYTRGNEIVVWIVPPA